MSQVIVTQQTQGATIEANTQKIQVNNDLRQMPAPLPPPKIRGFWPMIIFTFIIAVVGTGSICYLLGYKKGKAESETYYASSTGKLHKSTCVYFKNTAQINCKVCGGRAE